MVQSLYSCGANSIWEYSLLNPTSTKGGKRKPQATDPLHPNKAEFIRAKHQLLAYVFKPSKDSELVTESDLSKQLHSSVRTPNLETSLRLLSQGADPNYFHPEKNSTPLAVAGKAGQPFQVELLLVYGADPAAVDLGGKTASEHARSAGHPALATRLANAQYELSDRFVKSPHGQSFSGYPWRYHHDAYYCHLNHQWTVVVTRLFALLFRIII